MHDDAIWAMLRDCWGRVGKKEAGQARDVVSVSAAMAGLGLQRQANVASPCDADVYQVLPQSRARPIVSPRSQVFAPFASMVSRVRQLTPCRGAVQFHSDDASNWPCWSAPTGAAPTQDAAAQSVPSAIKPLHAQDQACGPHARTWWIAPGFHWQTGPRGQMPQQWLAHNMAAGGPQTSGPRHV